MSTELESSSTGSVELARVHRTSLFRALLVCALWIGTWFLRERGPEVRLGLDVVLALV
jgi:hypothetical protein